MPDMEKKIRDLKKTVSELTERFQPHENLNFDNYVDFTAKKLQEMQFISQYTISKSTTRVTTPKMNIVAKLDAIKPCDEYFGKVGCSIFSGYCYFIGRNNIFFPSKAMIESCFTMGHPMPPKNRTELILLINSTMEALVVKAANTIFEKKLGKENLISHHMAMEGLVENVYYVLYDNEAEELGDTKELVKDIHSLCPDGCFYVQDRGNPIMICEYKTPEEINEEDYFWFDSYCTSKDGIGSKEIEEFYQNSKQTKYEEISSFANIMKLFQHPYNCMTKYDCNYACVTSGLCWLFLYFSDKDKNTLNYQAVFVKDEESWKQAFEKLFSLVMKSSLKMLNNTQPYYERKLKKNYKRFRDGLE